jgi:hypothetical protein
MVKQTRNALTACSGSGSEPYPWLEQRSRSSLRSLQCSSERAATLAIETEERMTGSDKIHEAQDQVAGLQAQLDDVQRMLDKAERVAAAGEAAKARAQQLLIVSAVLVAIGFVLLVAGGKKKRYHT